MSQLVRLRGQYIFFHFCEFHTLNLQFPPYYSPVSTTEFALQTRGYFGYRAIVLPKQHIVHCLPQAAPHLVVPAVPSLHLQHFICLSFFKSNTVCDACHIRTSKIRILKQSTSTIAFWLSASFLISSLKKGSNIVKMTLAKYFHPCNPVVSQNSENIMITHLITAS